MLNFLNNQIKNYKNRVKSIKPFTLFQKLITFVISFLGNYHFLNVYLKNNFNFIAYNDSEITKKDVLNSNVGFNVNNITNITPVSNNNINAELFEYLEKLELSSKLYDVNQQIEGISSNVESNYSIPYFRIGIFL